MKHLKKIILHLHHDNGCEVQWDVLEVQPYNFKPYFTETWHLFQTFYTEYLHLQELTSTAVACNSEILNSQGNRYILFAPRRSFIRQFVCLPAFSFVFCNWKFAPSGWDQLTGLYIEEFSVSLPSKLSTYFSSMVLFHIFSVKRWSETLNIPSISHLVVNSWRHLLIVDTDTPTTPRYSWLDSILWMAFYSPRKWFCRHPL